MLTGQPPMPVEGFTLPETGPVPVGLPLWKVLPVAVAWLPRPSAQLADSARNSSRPTFHLQGSCGFFRSPVAGSVNRIIERGPQDAHSQNKFQLSRNTVFNCGLVPTSRIH